MTYIAHVTLYHADISCSAEIENTASVVELQCMVIGDQEAVETVTEAMVAAGYERITLEGWNGPVKNEWALRAKKI